MVCHCVRIPAGITKLQMNEAHYPSWIKSTISISHLLAIVNSSMNFIIYCLAAPRFRRALARKCTCMRRCRETTEARTDVEMTEMASIRTLRTLATGQSRQGTEAPSQVEMIEMTTIGTPCTLAVPLNGE